jgi:hypothetical protein
VALRQVERQEPRRSPLVEARSGARLISRLSLGLLSVENFLPALLGCLRAGVALPVQLRAPLKVKPHTIGREYTRSLNCRTSVERAQQ